MKNNVDPQHIKNKILFTTFIFRSLPMQYVKAISSDPQEWKYLNGIKARLCREGILNTTLSLQRMEFISLTQKGYTYITDSLLKDGTDNPMYKHKRSRSIRKGISEHHFMNFLYIWDFITKNPALITKDLRVYEDSNLNHCRIFFSYKAKRIMLSPDIIISIPTSKISPLRKISIIESDTGREQYKKLFGKLIDYAALAQSGMQENMFEGIDLYFVFHSQKRVQQFFTDGKGVVSFMSSYNSTDKVKDVPIEDIIKVYSSGNITVHYAFIEKGGRPTISDFKRYEFIDYLLAKNPAWKHFL